MTLTLHQPDAEGMPPQFVAISAMSTMIELFQDPKTPLQGEHAFEDGSKITWDLKVDDKASQA